MMPVDRVAPAEVEAASTEPRRLLARRLVLPPMAAGGIVFFLNNFLLARVLTSLPGGTLLATTTMAAVAIVVSRRRAFGAVTLLYATYGILGTLGHLGVDAGDYVLHLPRVLGAAMAFDIVLLLGSFSGRALALGLLPFGGMLLLGAPLSPRQWLIAFALAYAGLAAGALMRARLSRAGGS